MKININFSVANGYINDVEWDHVPRAGDKLLAKYIPRDPKDNFSLFVVQEVLWSTFGHGTRRGEQFVSIKLRRDMQ